ncbi:MAG: hypothetical protein ABIH65_04065 [Nanoarchaeota archaeon]
MGIEHVLSNVALGGRKTISYLLTDPFGESCLVTGGYIANNTSHLEIAYPLILTGIYHTIRLALTRKELNRSIKEYGWDKRIINKFSEKSWCSNRMTRAYSWSFKKYSEFKDIMTKHTNYYYFKKEIKRIFGFLRKKAA